MKLRVLRKIIVIIWRVAEHGQSELFAKQSGALRFKSSNLLLSAMYIKCVAGCGDIARLNSNYCQKCWTKLMTTMQVVHPNRTEQRIVTVILAPIAFMFILGFSLWDGLQEFWRELCDDWSGI